MFPSASEGLTFDDVLLVPQYNGIRSRRDVTTKATLGGHTFALPLISANMDTITGAAMAWRMHELGGFGVLHRFCSIDDNVTMVAGLVGHADPIAVSVGVGDKEFERAEALVDSGASIVCVDVAHAHYKPVNRMIRALRERYGDGIAIIAGNVATYAGADYLAAAGADAIKIGIGSGSACTTRIKTGFGVPQFSALLDCRKVDRTIIADGGIRTPGDAVKALAAGADFVMLGGMLAGTEETPGTVRVRQDSSGKEIRVKEFRGMASREAQEDYHGEMADWKTAEGVSMEVPCRGPVDGVIRDVAGGIRSGMTYAGAGSLDDLRRKAEFTRVSPATHFENGAHGMARAVPPTDS